MNPNHDTQAKVSHTLCIFCHQEADAKKDRCKACVRRKGKLSDDQFLKIMMDEQSTAEPRIYAMPQEFLTDTSVPARWRLLAVINGFHISGKPFYASNVWLKAKLNCSEQTVVNAVAELEEMGKIKCERTSVSRVIMRVTDSKNDSNQLESFPDNCANDPNQLESMTQINLSHDSNQLETISVSNNSVSNSESNKLKSLRDFNSSVRSKFPKKQKPKVRNPYIDDLISHLQKGLGVEKLDGSVKLNRAASWRLIQRFGQGDHKKGCERAKWLVDKGLSDEFYADKLTSIMYLENNALKIFKSGKKSNIAYIS